MTEAPTQTSATRAKELSLVAVLLWWRPPVNPSSRPMSESPAHWNALVWSGRRAAAMNSPTQYVARRTSGWPKAPASGGGSVRALASCGGSPCKPRSLVRTPNVIAQSTTPTRKGLNEKQSLLTGARQRRASERASGGVERRERRASERVVASSVSASERAIGTHPTGWLPV